MKNYGAVVEDEKSLENGDVQVVLHYKGKEIGITTQGDPVQPYFESLDYLVEKNCEIIVCGCRTSGYTYEKVVGLQEHGYDIIEYSNPYVKSIKEGDFADTIKALYARSVREIIEKRIEGEI